MRQYEFTEAISRRGFLTGLGSAAALAGAGSYLGGMYGNHKDEPQPEPVKQNNQVGLQQIFAKIHPNGQILMKTALQNGITGTELAQFMAQASAETTSFTALTEKGLGSKYLKKYEPKGKKHHDDDGVLTKEQILKLVKKITNPRARVLGNVLPGDGEKYKGRGFFQLTGRWNYTDAAEATGLDLVRHPELAADPKVAAQLAVWYWNKRVKPKINNFADTEAVTKFINTAGLNMPLRKAKFDIYKQYIK